MTDTEKSIGFKGGTFQELKREEIISRCNAYNYNCLLFSSETLWHSYHMSRMSKANHNYSKIICPYKRSIRILRTQDMHWNNTSVNANCFIMYQKSLHLLLFKATCGKQWGTKCFLFHSKDSRPVLSSSVGFCHHFMYKAAWGLLAWLNVSKAGVFSV